MAWWTVSLQPWHGGGDVEGKWVAISNTTGRQIPETCQRRREDGIYCGIWRPKKKTATHTHSHTHTFVWSHLTPITSFPPSWYLVDGSPEVGVLFLVRSFSIPLLLTVLVLHQREQLRQKHWQDELCCSFLTVFWKFLLVFHPPEDTDHLETGNLTCNQLMDETPVKVLPARCSHPRTVNIKTRNTEQA